MIRKYFIFSYSTIINGIRNMRRKLKGETVLSIGMLSLTFGILVGRFTYFEYFGFSISAFVEGVLYGLSLVMNLFYLVNKSKKLSTKS